MSKEKEVEKARSLWEQIMIGSKLNICTEELKGAGILDVNMLRLLYHNAEIIPKQIASVLKIPNSTLTNVINRLQKKGFIERKLNSDDLRSLQLVLTDKGKLAVQHHFDAERMLIADIFEMLNESETNTLINVLEKITKNL